MYNATEAELFSSILDQLATLTTKRGPTLWKIAAMQAQASTSQQAFDFEEAHYLNKNEGHFFQPNNNVPSYYHLG